jgi:hypothetical protein
MQHLEVSGAVVLYIGRTMSKMLFWEIIVYTLRIDKHMTTLCRKSAEFLTRKLMILTCSGHGECNGLN